MWVVKTQRRRTSAISYGDYAVSQAIALAEVERLEQIEREKGGVALVDVVGLNVEAERLEQPNAANPEDYLLLHPVGVVVAIEVMGDVRSS